MSQSSAPIRHPVLACADVVEDALKDAAGVDPVFMRTPDKAEALVRLTHLVDRLEITAPRQQQPGAPAPHQRRMGQALCDLLERIDPDTLPEHGGAATRVVVTIALGDLLHGLGVRHRECHAHGCTVPATWCEAHHRDPWAIGGRTDLAKAELLCSFHHHRIHHPDFNHHRMPDGSVRFHRRT